MMDLFSLAEDPLGSYELERLFAFDQRLRNSGCMLVPSPHESASNGDRECSMLPPVNQESQLCCEPNPTNPNPRLSNAWRRKRTASKSEPKLCRRVRSANSYPARSGNSRPLRASVSGYRLPDSSHRGRSPSGKWARVRDATSLCRFCVLSGASGQTRDVGSSS